MTQPTGPVPGRQTRRRVVLALCIVCLPLFVVVGLYRLRDQVDATSADTTGAYQAARQAKAFPVASPVALPSGWRALSSDFSDGQPAPVLRIGLRAPDGAGVQFVQSSRPADQLVPAELGESAHEKANLPVGDRVWHTYAAEKGLRALVLTEPARTIIVVGSTGEKDLSRLAETLV